MNDSSQDRLSQIRNRIDGPSFDIVFGDSFEAMLASITENLVRCAQEERGCAKRDDTEGVAYWQDMQRQMKYARQELTSVKARFDTLEAAGLGAFVSPEAY